MAPTRRGRSRSNSAVNVNGRPNRPTNSNSPRGGDAPNSIPNANNAAGAGSNRASTSSGSATTGNLGSHQQPFTFASSSSSLENSYMFATDYVTETKNITWEIKNFKAMVQMKGQGDGGEDTEIFFDAGRTIGMPSRWSFFILKFPDRENGENIGLFLRLEEYTGPEEKVFARYDSVIKRLDGEGEVVRRVLEVADMKAVEDWGWRNLATIAQLNSSGVLVNNTLTIELKFVLHGKPISKAIDTHLLTANTLERMGRESVINDLTTLFESGANADVAFRVMSRESGKPSIVKAHKIILTARSPVFLAMFECQMKESQTGEVVIDDLSEKALRILLKFVYTGSIDKEWLSIPEEIVYAADKYSFIVLKDYCDKMLYTTCNKENALKLLKLAKLHGLTTAANEIIQFIKTDVEGVMNTF